MGERTYGETKNCAGCRYWSEMIARSHGGNPVEALCLADGGPLAGKYVTSRRTCSAWKSGHLGAVDDPPNYGEETRAAYAAEECGECGGTGVLVNDGPRSACGDCNGTGKPPLDGDAA